MINIINISSSKNNTLDKKVKYIDVIQDWRLDYNLSCVVKYIARTSDFPLLLEDLRKAEWYLDRACEKEKSWLLKKVNSHQVRLGNITYSPQTVCENWKLTDLVCSTLINIFYSREHQSSKLKEKSLNAALNCLREEITLIEKKQGLNLRLRASEKR